MGFLDAIAETARRAATGDAWYVAARPYILELRSPGILPAGQSIFVLPVGPSGYRVRTVMRQSVTPTDGGLIAEERGVLWREITVSGSFGLAPKHGIDTTDSPEPFLGNLTTLSGPLWTRRMLRNIFVRYGELKADPDVGSATFLIWHDMRTDDHWVVVPTDVDIARSIDKRLQYPFTLNLKGTGDASAILDPTSTAESILDKIRGAIADVNAGLTLVSSAIQEGSALLGEVRYFAATIDQVIDNLTTIVASAQDFVDGVTDTISCGRMFITSTTEALDAVLGLLESAESLPAEVRQNYQSAADGLDAMASQLAAFGTTYDDEFAPIAAAEASAANTSRAELDDAAAKGPPTTSADMASRRTASTARDTIDSGGAPTGRARGAYGGTRAYTVRSGDSLVSIAAALLGDGALWYDIAIANGLSHPYVSATGAPGTVRPGATIAIPTRAGAAAGGVATAGQGSEPGEDLIGTDIAFAPAASDRPGRPAVDWAVDFRTKADVRLITGYGNLAQALQMRLWTERGTMPLAKSYGLRPAVGYGSTAADATALLLAYKETITADPRVVSVGPITLSAVADVYTIDASVLPIGASSSRAISSSIA